MHDFKRYLATVGDFSVLYVMATQQEYGLHLQTRIKPLIGGVGLVEAAAATGAALGALALQNSLPDLIVSLGSAGSRKLDHAKVYQLANVSYRDIDCSPFGFEKGRTPFVDEPAVIDIPFRIPEIPAASISSGGKIISGEDYDTIGADMADMESFSVLRAARRFGRPMIGLRGISDGRTEISKFEDWTEYLHIIDEKLADAIDRLAVFVESGRSGLRRL